MIVQMYNAILIHRTMSLYTAIITKVGSSRDHILEGLETDVINTN